MNKATISSWRLGITWSDGKTEGLATCLPEYLEQELLIYFKELEDLREEHDLDEVSKWEICYDDSGESERYGEGRWYVADENGAVLGDASFYTEQDAKEFLNDYLENGE